MDWTSSLHDVIFTTILNSDDEHTHCSTSQSTTYRQPPNPKEYQDEEEKTVTTKG